VSKKTSIVLVMVAIGGWVAAGLITAAPLLTETTPNPFLGRLSILVALASAVLSVGAWVERSSSIQYKHTIAVDVAHGIGFQQGWNARGIMAPDDLPRFDLQNQWTEDLGSMNANTGPRSL
jgi:hypothetical protein